MELAPSEERELGSLEIANRWRELAGPIPGAEELRFVYSNLSAGADLHVRVAGTDRTEIRRAIETVRDELAGYAGVHDVETSYRAGKDEIRIELRTRGRLLRALAGRRRPPGPAGVLGRGGPEAPARPGRGRGGGSLPGRRAPLGGEPGADAGPDHRRDRRPPRHGGPALGVQGPAPDPPGRPEAGRRRDRVRRHGDRHPGRGHGGARARRPDPGPGRPSRGEPLRRGRAARAPGGPHGALPGLGPRAVRHLRADGDPLPVLRPAPDRDVRDPLRAGGGAPRAPAARALPQPRVPVWGHRPGRGGGQRQPGPRPLREPRPLDRHVGRPRGPGGRGAALPAHPPHVAHDLRPACRRSSSSGACRPSS